MQLLSAALDAEKLGGRPTARAALPSAVLTLSVIFAFVLPLAGVTASSERELSLSYLSGNALLIFPLALGAVRIALWASRKLRTAEQSTLGLMAQAAIAAGLFALVLFSVSGPRQALERAFGAAPARVSYGHSRDAPSRLDVNALIGLRDATVGFVASLPLIFFGLVLLSRRDKDGSTSANVHHPKLREYHARIVVPTGIAVAAVAAWAAGSMLLLSNGLHRDSPGAHEHAHLATRVPVDDGFAVEDMRVTVQSAQWLRRSQLVERVASTRAVTAAANDVDRVYLEVTFKNAGGGLRSIGRGAFRIVASDGANWAPLADDFPEILLEPADTLTTRLIFQVPPEATQLALTSTEKPVEKRIPVGDDSIDALVGALCRALSKAGGT